MEWTVYSLSSQKEYEMNSDPAHMISYDSCPGRHAPTDLTQHGIKALPQKGREREREFTDYGMFTTFL
jgi:hypothetical protein